MAAVDTASVSYTHLWYNDSIASSPTRAIAGLKCFDGPIVLIAGGYDKHIPFDELGREICSRVDTLLLCGATADKIEAAVNAAGSAKKPRILDVYKRQK